MDNICLIIQGPSVNVNILKEKYIIYILVVL